VAGAALLISAAITLGLDGYAPYMLGSMPVSTWLLGGVGVALLITGLARR
jgi:ubiquinone biosynthesis protein